MKSERIGLYVTAGILALLSLADIVLTRFGLHRYGGVELNPVVGPFVDSITMFTLKTVGVALVGYLVARYARSQWLANALYGVTILYGVIVASNLTQIIIAEAL